MAFRSGMLALGFLWFGVLQTTLAISDASTAVEGVRFLQLQSADPSACTPQNMRVRKEWYTSTCDLVQLDGKKADFKLMQAQTLKG